VLQTVSTSARPIDVTLPGKLLTTCRVCYQRDRYGAQVFALFTSLVCFSPRWQKPKSSRCCWWLSCVEGRASIQTSWQRETPRKPLSREPKGQHNIAHLKSLCWSHMTGTRRATWWHRWSSAFLRVNWCGVAGQRSSLGSHGLLTVRQGHAICSIRNWSAYIIEHSLCLKRVFTSLLSSQMPRRTQNVTLSTDPYQYILIRARYLHTN
jgi:hypothetical protein